MSVHKVVLDLDETGRGIVTVDGMPVNTTGVTLVTTVNDVAHLTVNMVLVAIKSEVVADVHYQIAFRGEIDGFESYDFVAHGETVLDALKDAVAKVAKADADMAKRDA